MYGRAGQRGDERVVREVRDGRRLRRGQRGAARRRHLRGDVPQQQGGVSDGGGPDHRGRPRRRGSGHDGRAHRPARRRAQDRERRAPTRLRHGGGGRRGHPRPTALPATRDHRGGTSGGHRTGVDGSRARSGLEDVHPPHDRARAGRLFGPLTRL